VAENIDNETVLNKVAAEVDALCKQFPVRESFV